MRVFITGGTGTLGKALIWQLLADQELHNEVVVFSRDELKQSQVRHSVGVHFPNQTKQVSFMIGDVRDYSRVREAIKSSDPSVVIHAAAMKQIPTCEEWPVEAIQTNVLGTKNILQACEYSSVEQFVLVSSDKACEPYNVYGKTKALAESLTLARWSDPLIRRFCVRYGNVLGSRGSVFEIWKHQAQHGDPLSVTDSTASRFFFSVQQAAKFILFVLALKQAGNIFVPSMRSVVVADLAKALFPDSQLVFTGLRAGEKFHEKLIADSELSSAIYSPENKLFVIGRNSKHAALTNPFIRSSPASLVGSSSIRGWVVALLAAGLETL